MIASIALLPLFLLIPLLGKYIDVKLNTIAASRKLAFECTVNAAACSNLDAHTDIVDGLRSQYFRQNGQEVLANDPPNDVVNDDPNRNQLWVDRKGKALIENYSDIGAVVDPVTFNPLQSAGIFSNVNLFGSVLGAGPSLFGFDVTNGLYNARVQVNLSKSQTADFTTELYSMPLKIQQHTAVLSDAWNASGAADVSGRVHTADSIPDQAASVAYLPATTLITLASPFEAHAGEFHLHAFDPDVVPFDRLTQSQ
ncbi:MAG: hypothetical protein JO002_06690 [Burkholderiaceae bacterium]|nr:hypothetical protein [Burkholderiaceae bacterium]